MAEVRIGFQLEWALQSDEILEIWLNEIYFGSGCYGVKAAASLYFHKDVARLNLAESALLAGIPQAPSLYSPIDHPKEARRRCRMVLDSMHERQLLTEARYAIARKEMTQFKF